MILSNECWMKDACWKVKHSDTSCLTENKYCPKLFRLNELYNKALLSSKQRLHLDLRLDEDRCDLDIFNQLKQVEENIELFVNSGSNLYLYSRNTGCGKTSWALRLIQSYFNRIWYKSDLECHALFIHVPRYLISLKDSFNERNEYVDYIKDNLTKADLVVFDEISYKPATSFELETLLNIINTRIDMGKANIFTSNDSPEEFKNKLGDRLYSRVINTSTLIQFVGSDKRNIRS